ncbi:MAG TPA: hypothetical protein VHO70_21070 [Chitinispirillaceae bacterium]|nr:hypothetical protein [Chitinispirillaceae bacterium]
MREPILKLSFLVHIISYFFTASSETCELSINTCPENFSNQTIEVPQNMTSLSPKIHACDAGYVFEGVYSSQEPPSIMFVIDHSYSMLGLGNTYPGNDTYGMRFKVTRDLIDTVYSKFPGAEIGVVVFREVLYLDHRNNALLRQLNGMEDQSFLPLLQLDKKVNGNQTGIEAIKELLKTDTVIRHNEKANLNVECSDLLYNPQFTTIGNTNINSAFDAALQAMSSAKNPKRRQFIIFLSDGEPHPLNDNSQHGNKDPFFFQMGTNTPATFTVYLSNTATTPPQSLQLMTQNIQNNNYSESNKFSAIWTHKSEYNSLMSLFSKNILGTILTVVSGTPTSLTLNNQTSSSYNNNSFTLNNPIPLTEPTTRLQFTIKYHLINHVSGAQKDTSTMTNITIVKRGNAVLPDGLSKTCTNDAYLTFYYNGNQISAATDDMKEIEVRLISGPSEIPGPVTITITNKDRTAFDKLSLNARQNNSYWSQKFHRSVSETAHTDQILQHRSVDSIVAIFKYPPGNNDSLRIAIPFNMSSQNSSSVAYTVVTVNNPFSENSSTPDIVRSEFTKAKLDQHFKTNSMVLSVVPEKGDQVSSDQQISGTITIFDVAKNIIISKAEMFSISGRLFYLWDGRDSKQNRVASGTYSAAISYRDTQGKKHTKSIRIGVKR